MSQTLSLPAARHVFCRCLACALFNYREEVLQQRRLGIAQPQQFEAERRHGGAKWQRSATPPFQQTNAKFRFERCDLTTERRLANVKTLGRAAEGEFLRDGDKRAQVPQVHGEPLDAEIDNMGQPKRALVATSAWV